MNDKRPQQVPAFKFADRDDEEEEENCDVKTIVDSFLSKSHANDVFFGFA